MLVSTRTGMIGVPPVGEVAVGGLLPEAAEQAIAMTGVERQVYVKPPHVTVKIDEKKANRVLVVGEVKRQGEVELRQSGSTLLAAIMAAGGLTGNASLDVEIRHPARRQMPPGGFEAGPSLAESGVEQASFEVAAAGQATTEKVDLLEAVELGNRGYYLSDGDVVHVGQRPPQAIHVIGLVRRPGEYRIKPHEEVRVLNALAKAGWRNMAIADKVSVYRQVPGSEEPIRIPISLREAQRGR